MATQRDRLLALLQEFGIEPEDTGAWMARGHEGADPYVHWVVLATDPDSARAEFEFDAAGAFVQLRVVES